MESYPADTLSSKCSFLDLPKCPGNLDDLIPDGLPRFEGAQDSGCKLTGSSAEFDDLSHRPGE